MLGSIQELFNLLIETFGDSLDIVISGSADLLQ